MRGASAAPLASPVVRPIVACPGKSIILTVSDTSSIMPEPQPTTARPDGGPPRCLDCYYVLAGLGSGVCPECGRGFDLDASATYTTRPPFVRWKLWMPGLLLAGGFGAVVTGAMLLAGAGVGWGLTAATPFSVGALLGYRCRTGVFYIVLLAIAATILAFSPLVALHISGLLCGVVAIGVTVVPAALGGFFGWVLRRCLKVSRYPQAAWLPVVGLLMLGPGVTLVESLVPRGECVVAVRTSRVFEASPRRVWEALRFYDELDERDDPPPILFRLGMPRPVETARALQLIGDEQVCVFTTGRVTKTLTQRDRPRRLAFAVTRQRIGFERSVALRGGSFDLEPVGPGRTRVTLTTEYDALLRPRFMWTPAERLIVHALHEYILDAIAPGGDSPGAVAAVGP